MLTVLSDPEKEIRILMLGRKGHPDKVNSSAAPGSALGGMIDSLSFVHEELMVVTLHLQFIAKVNVCHFGNGKLSQHCERSCKSLMTLEHSEML